jgi:hypothetical protein
MRRVRIADANSGPKLPPKPDGLVANLDAALMKQILGFPQRKREADVQHHRQTDDLGARLEPLEGASLGHGRTLFSPLPRRKPSSSDSALARVTDNPTVRLPAVAT